MLFWLHERVPQWEGPQFQANAVTFLQKVKSAWMISNMYMKYCKLEGTWLAALCIILQLGIYVLQQHSTYVHIIICDHVYTDNVQWWHSEHVQDVNTRNAYLVTTQWKHHSKVKMRPEIDIWDEFYI